MQKIFIKYFLIIMIVTVIAVLAGTLLLQTYFSQSRAIGDAGGTLEEIKARIESNERIIDDLTISLDENYIARAKAFAEIIAQNPKILEDYDEMVRIRNVLNVDEVHVIDENGYLMWGSVKEYYGMDFDGTDQTRPFLAALTDKDFALAQTPQPNGIEGKLFQYIGVARQDKPGVAQVGVAPHVLDDALANNKIDIVIANFNVERGVNVVVFDSKTGIVLADSKKELIGKTAAELGTSDQFLNGEKTSGWIERAGHKNFAVYGQVGGYLMEVSYTKENLYAERKNQIIAAIASSLLLGLAIIIAIFILLKRRIIDDMILVNRDLEKITEGDLTVTVAVGSTPEFASLSQGINEMVASLRQQVGELEEQNINILASLKYARKIQNNLLPSPRAFDETFSDYCVLWEPRDEVGGDIYWMKGFEEGGVLCVCDCTGHGTPGALLTMIVVTALDAIVDKNTYKEPAHILWELEQRLVSILNVSDSEKSAGNINDGADLAILFIKKDGGIALASAKLHVFVCDGKTVEDVRGQKLSIGDGSLRDKEQIKTVLISPSKGKTYYIVSDGLFEQIGGKDRIPFGYKRFKQIILENYERSTDEVSKEIWKEFELYMGSENRRDDVTLVSFKL